MERLNLPLIILLSTFFTGCSSSLFYEKIKEMDKINEASSKEEIAIHYIKNKKIDIDKYVFSFLKKELKNTSHIYYFIQPTYIHNDFNRINIIVFDVDHKKYYYLQNKSFFSKKIISINELNVFDEEYYKYIYELFNNESCDELVRIGTENNESGGNEVIYEINFKKNVIRKCNYPSVFIIPDA